jgi:hypothetical protein
MDYSPESKCNESVRSEYRDMLRRHLTACASRSDALVKVMQENDRRGHPLSEAEVFALVSELAPAASAPENGASGVSRCYTETQETQKPTITQGETTKPSEFEGGAAAPQVRADGAQQNQAARIDAPPKLPPGIPLTLPFPEYLGWAIQEFRRHLEQDFPPEWQGLFYLVRLVKSHPSMTRKTAEQAFREVDSVVRSWHKGKRATDAWQQYVGERRDDAEATFLDAWEKVRNLLGRSPLENALEQAERCPLIVGQDKLIQRPEKYALFVSMAGWLQVAMGDRNIALPCREIGDLLDVDKMTVSRYRKWAVQDGYLKEMNPARFAGKRGQGKATEFRFNVAKFSILEEQAQ